MRSVTMTSRRRAEQLVDGHAVELWQEARKIAEFKPHKQGRK
jgi:hypothetical protein